MGGIGRVDRCRQRAAAIVFPSLQGVGVKEQHPHCHDGLHIPPPHCRPPRHRPASGPAAEGGGLLHLTAPGTGEDRMVRGRETQDRTPLWVLYGDRGQRCHVGVMVVVHSLLFFSSF